MAEAARTDRHVDLIQMEQITKRFPGVTALDSVSFTLQHGEVHALLGENGAGKSTLMKILSGMYQATSGRIFVDGREADIRRPEDALRYGIGMVYQSFTLAPELTVLENILLGTKLPFFLRKRELEEKVTQVIEAYGLHTDLSAKVWQLSVGEQQRVEIIKCFFHGARILILDEPTSVLTPPEVEELFVMMRRFVSQGCSVIFISHKLGEVLQAADRITVFRKGRMVGAVQACEATEQSLSQLMVGRNVDLSQEENPVSIGNTVLQIQNVIIKNEKGLSAVDDVTLTLHAHEILGIAAVSGNGQAELAEAIAGLRRVSSGSIRLDTGEELTRMRVCQIIHAGVGNISEKRLDRSLIPNFSIAQNLIVKDYKNKRFHRRGMLDTQAIRTHAQALIQEYDIATTDCDKPVRMLSGGNLQKVVLARELSRSPKIILAVNPTYGLDVGAIEAVQKQLIAQRNMGAGILLVSEELDEVLRLSDRIAIMHRGKVVAILEKREFNRERIGLLMTGGAEGVSCSN